MSLVRRFAASLTRLLPQGPPHELNPPTDPTSAEKEYAAGVRPVAGENRYFVVTTWASQADFEAWRDSREFQHGHGGGEPVSSGADLLKFEVVELI